MAGSSFNHNYPQSVQYRECKCNGIGTEGILHFVFAINRYWYRQIESGIRDSQTYCVVSDESSTNKYDKHEDAIGDYGSKSLGPYAAIYCYDIIYGVFVHRFHSESRPNLRQ